MNKRTRNPISRAAGEVVQQSQAPSDRNLQALPQHQFLLEQHAYQGQIPPPALLREFDAVQAGTSAKLIQWAEDEQAHRRTLEIGAQEANIASQKRQLDIAERQSSAQIELATYQAKAVKLSDVLGQLLGFSVCAGCAVGSYLLAMAGNTGGAVALAAIPTAAIVQSFRGKFFSDDKPSAKK